MQNTRIIGHELTTMFRFNCCVESSPGIVQTEFQVSGSGKKCDIEQLHNLLSSNGFQIRKVEQADRSIPITEYC